jgi:hypothetical protein
VLGTSVAQSAREFLGAIDDFEKRDFPRAVSMALNKTTDGARVDASREIRARFKVKVATVNKAFFIQKASPQRWVAVLNIKGRPLSLAGFGPRQTKRGVSVSVKGVRKLIPGAFLRTLKTKDDDEYTVVFMRKGKARYPLKALKTVDLPGLFKLEAINQPVRVQVVARFEKELASAARALWARS